MLGGVLALRDDQPGGGVLHPRRRHLREAGGAARTRGTYRHRTILTNYL